jgi:hypothetical protein
LLRILDLHPLRDRSRRILEAVGALGDDPFEVVSADLAKKCQTVAATCFVQMIVADCFGTTAPENRSSGSLYVGPVVGDRRKLEAQGSEKCRAVTNSKAGGQHYAAGLVVSRAAGHALVEASGGNEL